MADKDKAHLGCLEEDDEFEEFPAEGKFRFLPQTKLVSMRQHYRTECGVYTVCVCACFYLLLEWTGNKEDEDDVNVWEDNWDDDNVEDDFNNQLRAQLESQKK